MKVLLLFIILYLIFSTIGTYYFLTKVEDKKVLINYYFPWKLRKITDKVNIIGCTLYSLILIIISPVFFILSLLYLLVTFKYPIKKEKYNKSVYFMKKDFDENSWKSLCTVFGVPVSYNFIYLKFDANSVKEQQQYIEEYKSNKEKGK